MADRGLALADRDQGRHLGDRAKRHRPLACRLGDRRQRFERIEWSARVGRQHRLVQSQLFDGGAIGCAIECRTIDCKGFVGAPSPTSVPGAKLDDVHQQLVVARHLLGRGQHLVRLDVRADLVQRLAQQQADFGCHAVHQRSSR